jgi:hypothetical protein
MGKRDKIFPKFRRGIISDYLPWILIAVAVLVILMITIFLLREKGVSLIDQLKNLLR